MMAPGGSGPKQRPRRCRGKPDTMSVPVLWFPVLGIHPHVKDTTTGKLLVRGFEDFPDAP